MNEHELLEKFGVPRSVTEEDVRDLGRQELWVVRATNLIERDEYGEPTAAAIFKLLDEAKLSEPNLIKAMRAVMVAVKGMANPIYVVEHIMAWLLTQK